MKILITGEYWKGSLCYSYYKAFCELGHQVIFFDVPAEYKKTSSLTGNFLANKILSPVFSRSMNARLLKVALDFGPALCVIMKGRDFFRDTLIKIKKHSLLFNINSDDPFSRNRGASSRHVREGIPLFDCYFVWTKSLIPALKSSGALRVEQLPFGYDSGVHYPVKPTQEEARRFGSDLAFVGNWDSQRELWLGYLEDFDLKLWGEYYWGKRCKNKRLRAKWSGSGAYAEMMSKILNASKITLNVLRKQNKGNFNMRTFEIPACGGFTLAESSDEAKEFFREEKEAVYFSEPDELREKVKYYLAHDEQRAEIAEAGLRRCIEAGYSYVNRARQVLKVYNEIAK